MWKAVQEIFGHVIWNDVANVQDISCGRLCRKCLDMWNDVANVQDILCGRLCKKFLDMLYGMM